jgi:hypothetical protein
LIDFKFKNIDLQKINIIIKNVVENNPYKKAKNEFGINIIFKKEKKINDNNK